MAVRFLLASYIGDLGVGCGMTTTYLEQLFPYVSEPILQRVLHTLLIEKAAPIADLPALEGLMAFLDEEKAKPIQILAQLPLRFENDALKIDGFQRLDLGIALDNGKIIPVEVKAGYTPPLKVVADIKAGCTFSDHKPPRLSGNMIALLNRNFQEGLKDEFENVPLLAECPDDDAPEIPNDSGPTESAIFSAKGGTLKLTDRWLLLTRRKTFENWQSLGEPKATTVAIEDLCLSLGEPAFNDICAELLAPAGYNYFKKWMRRP